MYIFTSNNYFAESYKFWVIVFSFLFNAKYFYISLFEIKFNF
jgi:hypothetical protein